MITRQLQTITLIDPVTKQTRLHHLESRSFYTYRNKGFVLLRPDATQPFVFSTLEELQAQHRDEFAYELRLRKTYNVPTYGTMCGVVSDSHEPFYSIDSLQSIREYRFRTQVVELRPHAVEWAKNHLPLPAHMLWDAVAIDGTSGHAALATSSSDEQLNEGAIRAFHNVAHGTFFLSQKTTDGEFQNLWGSFFRRTVHLYMGIFGPKAPSLAAMHWPLARSLGITLLVQHQLRFFVLRTP